MTVIIPESTKSRVQRTGLSTYTAETILRHLKDRGEAYRAADNAGYIELERVGHVSAGPATPRGGGLFWLFRITPAGLAWLEAQH